jgi:Leishmanolysin
MHTVTGRAGLALMAFAIPLLLTHCKGSSESPSVATTIVITPPQLTMGAIGGTKTFTAVVKDQRGQPMAGVAVAWTSTNTAVVTVGNTTGLAMATGNGSAQITATFGTINQNAAITVAQVAAQIVKVSGDAQTGTVGQALAQPLVVQLNDSNAHPIAADTVTFAATTGGGNVGSAKVASGAGGQAQTTWTLVGLAGSQGVSASATGGATPASFSATANAGPAASVAKQAGDGQTSTTGVTVVTAPAVMVKDAFGNGKAGVTVTFSVSAGNGSITGASQTTNSNGLATVGSWTLGNVGTDTLVATATGAGLTGNPALFTATSLSASAPANVAVFVGNNQPGLVGYGVNVRPAVRVTNAASNPVANATVTFAVQTGGGSVTSGVATTNGNGVAQVGKWTLGASAGVNTLTATVTGAGITGNPVTFSDTGSVGTYTISVIFFGPTPSGPVQAAMDSAVAKWQRLIYRQLSSIPLNLAAKTACGDTTTPAVNVTTTGLVILAKFDSIDGPGKILGQAGPCLIRNSNALSVLGEMEFDTADVANMITNGSLNSVMLHEMGHVIGFGTLWNQSPNNCLQLASDSVNHLDTYFSCPKAQAEFDSLGGTSYTGASLSPPGGNIVPVENCGASSPSGCGSGTVNGHWREPVLGNELMTGYINAGVNPLSAISVAAQGDLGYTVNYDAADTYVHVFTAPAALGTAPLFMGNDIRRGPIYLVNELGRVVGVR